MKRLALILSVLLVSVVSLKAQSGFGIKFGMNFNSMSDLEFKEMKESISRRTGFHAGVLYKIDLPVGLAIQPELLYVQKGGAIEAGSFKMHYIQLPVNIQWGIDLVLFRPFVMVSPFLGYQLSKDSNIQGLKWDTEKLGYGIGFGAGLDVWKFQLTGRYCWDLGNVIDYEWEGIDTFKGGKNKGFELSLAFIF